MITLQQLSDGLYEDLNGSIVSVSFETAGYSVVLECNDWNDLNHRRRFALVFTDVVESTAMPSSADSFKIVEEHPALWKHNDPHAELYFSSAPDDSVRLIGELYEAGRLSKWLHADSSLLAQGYGLLARGPKRVIDNIRRVIGDRLPLSIVEGHVPKGGYKAALFDECYLVFRDAAVNEELFSSPKSDYCRDSCWLMQ